MRTPLRSASSFTPALTRAPTASTPAHMITPLALASSALQNADSSGSGVRETFKLLDQPATWIIVLVVIPIAILLAWLSYGREPLARGRKITLGTLRVLAFLLLAAVIARPVFVERHEELRPAEVLLLVDDSASMRRKDAYGGDDRARETLRGLVSRPPADATRSELTRAALDKVLLPHLKDKGYAARLFRFSDALEPMTETSSATGKGHATHIGDALAVALSMHRGRHVTDIVVLSDGRNNGGLSPLEAARAAGASAIPVHTLVIGDTRPERNVLVELIEAPQSVLDGDEIAISARVVGRGTESGQKARLLLEELSANGDSRPLGEEEVALDESGSRTVLVAPAGTPDLRSNERRFRISVPPLPDETLRDDNAIELSVHVTPEKIRVLFVDAYPRWEYRYLKNLLLRSDQNLEVQCFLLTATTDFVQESTRGVPGLRAVPTSRKDLLEHYDVVILGDVNPYQLSPDPARCEEFLASLREFVERGGGLILEAGEFDNPRAFAGTALEELLPVVIDSTGALAFETDATVEFRPLVEDAANPHEVVRLTQDPQANRALWETEGGLRGFYWFAPVVRAKPGAQVLLRHPTAANSHGLQPLLVAGYFPAGRTLFLAVDATWVWRFRYGDRYHERFWRNAIRWVALGRLKSGDRRIQLDALKTTYDLDERVTLEARVLDEDYRPSEKSALDARLQHPDGSASDVKLALVPDRPGLYRTAFDLDRAGLYQAYVENEGVRAAATEFEVVLPSRENADPTPDPAGMRAIAALTPAARALDLARVRDLVGEFPGGEEDRSMISSELRDAWDNAWTLALALTLLALEWILRKRWELV